MMLARQEYIDRIKEAQTIAIENVGAVSIPRITIFYDTGDGLEYEGVEQQEFLVNGEHGWSMDAWADWVIPHMRQRSSHWFVGVAIIFRVPTVSDGVLSSFDVLCLSVCERLAANTIGIVVEDIDDRYRPREGSKWGRVVIPEEDNLAYNMLVPMRQLTTLQG